MSHRNVRVVTDDCIYRTDRSFLLVECGLYFDDESVVVGYILEQQSKKKRKEERRRIKKKDSSSSLSLSLSLQLLMTMSLNVPNSITAIIHVRRQSLHDGSIHVYA